MAWNDLLLTDTFVKNYMGIPILSSSPKNKLLTFKDVHNSDYGDIVEDTSNFSNKIIKIADLQSNSNRDRYLNKVWFYTSGYSSDDELCVDTIHNDINLNSTMDTYDQVSININYSDYDTNKNFVLDTDYTSGDCVPGLITGAGGHNQLGINPIISVTISSKILSGPERYYSTASIGNGSVWVNSGNLYIQTNSWLYIIQFGGCTLSDVVIEH